MLWFGSSWGSEVFINMAWAVVLEVVREWRRDEDEATALAALLL